MGSTFWPRKESGTSLARAERIEFDGRQEACDGCDKAPAATSATKCKRARPEPIGPLVELAGRAPNLDLEMGAARERLAD